MLRYTLYLRNSGELMKTIRLYSDLHQEHKFGKFQINKISDEENQVLILAGDIANMKDIVRGEYDNFFNDLNERFYAIFYVMGNHEYYGKFSFGDKKSSDKIKDYFSKFNKITILDRYATPVEIDGFLFVGATLFTDLNKLSPALIDKSSNDFKLIKYVNEGRYSKFKPVHWLREFNLDYSYIRNVVKNNNDKKIVVITHHAVSEKSFDLVEDPTVSYTEFYRSKLDNFIEENSHIVFWVYGHIHTKEDFMVGGTRVKSNPIGYYSVTDDEKNSILKV